ncbi:SpoIIE family protein phosphatase [Desulfobacterales bacterium HSG2]|nr:SpoIIE family protein phosphatase [Desulfobacterales bacterium HSG2]
MTNEETQHRKPESRVARARPRCTSAPKASSELAKPEPEDRTPRKILAKLRHDLRTPLNAVIGYSEMLLEDAEDLGHEDLISDLRNIHSAGNTSLELVNAVLHPAKIESDQTKFSPETFGVSLRHELHTPSNAIISFTERLLKKAEDLGKEDDFIAESIPDLQNIRIAAEAFLTLIRGAESLSNSNARVREVKSPVATKKNCEPVKEKLAVATEDRGDLLVVDDDYNNRVLLSRHLERHGHHVMIAENGRQALAMIEDHTFDMVLLDIMMPEVDGYQVLQHLKSDDILRNIPVIMISALDEMGSVVRCIEMGAEDYLAKPFDPVLLKARVGAVLEKKRLRDIEQKHLKTLRRELEIGRNIQSSFLPDSLPKIPGWEIAACFHPARQVSGDFYDAFLLSGGQEVGIVIADVCDKGVGAALFMGLFRSLIRAFMDMHYSRSWMTLIDETEKSPGNLASGDKDRDSNHENALKIVVSLTNDYIAKNHSKANMFATLFLGVIEPETGILIYINGGHEPPVIAGPAGVKEHLKETGPAVGALPLDMLPPGLGFGTGKTRMEPGDILVSFTDGITEALGPNDEFYTKERLFKLLTDPADSADAMLDRIETSLSDHTAGAEQSDDITLLAVRRTPTGESS